MPKFTDKQQAFIDGKAAGLKNAAAATAAGYASTSAAVTASQLLGRDDIKRAVAAAKRKLRSAGAPTGKAEDEDIPDRNKMPKASYSDAKEFLLDAMNHPMLPIAVRGDYAKALLPYQHGRVGETGKKQSKKERAEEIAAEGRGGAKPKFATKAAPGGNVVAIRR